MENLDLNIISSQNAEGKEFWLKKLTGNWNKAVIPYDYLNNYSNKVKHDSVERILNNEVSQKLLNISSNSDFNLATILMSVLNIFLKRYTQSSDIVIGIPVLTEDRKKGVVNDNLIIRNSVLDTNTFQEVIINTKSAFKDAVDHQNYPLKEIENQLLKLKEKEDQSNLFDIALLIENIHDIASVPENTSLVFAFKKQENEISLKLQFNSLLYDLNTIERIIDNYLFSLELLLNNLKTQLSEIEILQKSEENLILNKFNETSCEIKKGIQVNQLFQEQVKKSPKNKAVVFADSHLTYEELDLKSDQLANILLNKGCNGKTVGLYVAPSLEMVIGIWAIIKAGASFLPIDNFQPEKRIENILTNSSAHLLLKQSNLSIDINFDHEIIDLDKIEYNDEKIKVKANYNEQLYVIYTSGSTGNPKGVCISHTNIFNYNSWFSDEAKVNSEDKSIFTTSFGCDLAYTLFFSCMLAGAELHLVPKELYVSAKKLVRYIDQNNISIVKMTPTLFNKVVNSEGSEEELWKNLRLVVLGGEQIKTKDVETFHKAYKDVHVMNHYGPSETTIGSIAGYINFNNFDNFKKRPILGKPISNTQVYILNENSKFLPIGVAGEICISGEGVGLGYLNDNDLTNQSFITNPFDTSKRLYRTGDLGRWLHDGTIEFLGRIDNQVKYLGNRIELSEIEKQMLAFNQIKEVAVVLNSSDKNSEVLCAYYISEVEIDDNEIRKFLNQFLPQYMIPTNFIKLTELPLTLNGKIDKNSLPKPQVGGKKESIKPRNETENILRIFWSETLGLDKEIIGIDSNFFELGGDSFKIIELNEKLNEKFEIEISIVQMFENHTIRMLSQLIENMDNLDPVIEEDVSLDEDEDHITPDRTLLHKLRTED